jgi:hypothetical protein
MTFALSVLEPLLPRTRLLMTLREKLIKIGVKVARHSRYATFQLAEVAVPRKLFRITFRLIDGLRPSICRHKGPPSRSIQIDPQDKCVLHKAKRAVAVRNSHEGRVSHRQIGLIRGGARPIAPVPCSQTAP